MEENRYPIRDEVEGVGDLDRIPPMGPFSDEEAIARIEDFERRLAKGEVKWTSSEEFTKHLYEKFPWLK